MDPIVGALGALETPHHRENGSALSHRVVVDFNDAMVEARDGLYGITVVQARGEHHSGLSIEQAAEFRHRLVSLVEECFAPGQGDRTGIKHGFNWALTPIDLHPFDDDRWEYMVDDWAAITHLDSCQERVPERASHVYCPTDIHLGYH